MQDIPGSYPHVPSGLHLKFFTGRELCIHRRTLKNISFMKLLQRTGCDKVFPHSQDSGSFGTKVILAEGTHHAGISLCLIITF